MRKLIEERSHYQRAQRCNPPATMQEVRAFEREMHITLPENYVRYLTELGNGGPGGSYILYSLARVKQGSEASPEWMAEKAKLPPMLDHSLSDEDWKAFGEKYTAADENDEDTSEMQKQILAGGLVIGTAGCIQRR